LNNGSGLFTMTRAILPVGTGETMDSESGHWPLGTTLADLNGDGLPELIVTGDNTSSFQKLTRTTILWNRSGAFSENDKTELPVPSPFTKHIELDAQSIDLNGDGLPDLVVVGTQGEPFYDGWFVQLLVNRGDRTFVDITTNRLAAGDVAGGTPGAATGAPWPKWVKVLDFNADDFPDFSVEYFPGSGLPQSQPLIYLNDGRGFFSTLRVRDFVSPGNELVLGGAHLMPTRNGYSFITPYRDPRNSGLRLRGLLARKPYRDRTSPSGPPSQISSGASIYSSNGQYQLTYQLDGNLVIFDTRANMALWATNTAGTTPGLLTMQSDGNLVLSDGAGIPRWASNTGGNPGAYFVLQNDGNLVIHSASDQLLWDRFR
jgi:hypothetical protein